MSVALESRSIASRVFPVLAFAIVASLLVIAIVLQDETTAWLGFATLAGISLSGST